MSILIYSYLSSRHLGLRIEGDQGTLYYDPKQRLQDFDAGCRLSNPSLVNTLASLKIDIPTLTLYTNWPIVLDEALRLLGPKATLGFTFFEGDLASRAQFFAFFNNLLQAKGIEFTLLSREGDWSVYASTRLTKWLRRFQSQAFRAKKVAKRKALRARNAAPHNLVHYQIALSKPIQALSKHWSFGLVVNYEPPHFLQSFLQSIEQAFAHQSTSQYEIIINGPLRGESLALVQKSPLPIKHIETGGAFAKQGWITEKKNVIVKEASYENVAIFHNRYALLPNWLEVFEQFGYDFAALDIRQRYHDQEFPSWTAVPSSRAGYPTLDLDSDDYHPGLFIGGGTLVAKKHTLSQVPLNEFLLWNEGEDVELSKRLIQTGFLPRYLGKEPVVKMLRRRTQFSFIKPKPSIFYPFSYPLIPDYLRNRFLKYLLAKIIGLLDGRLIS